MGRRIFNEYGFKAEGNILSSEKMRIFSDREAGFSISKECRDKLLSVAEGLVGKSYPCLLATDYMMFRRNGNRSLFQHPYFERRHDMLRLAIVRLLIVIDMHKKRWKPKQIGDTGITNTV